MRILDLEDRLIEAREENCDPAYGLARAEKIQKDHLRACSGDFCR